MTKHFSLRLLSVLMAAIAISMLAMIPAVLHAVPMTFFGEDNALGSLPVPNSIAAQTEFLSNLVGAIVEDFESFESGETFPLTVAFNGDTATLDGTNYNLGYTGILDYSFFGRFAISGEKYLHVGHLDAANFSLTFGTPQAAFGFFATDIGDFEGQLKIQLDNGLDFIVPHSEYDGAAFFWGIIDVDNTFSNVTFSNTSGTLEDVFGFDDFTIGRKEQVSGVPEPSVLFLLCVASLIGLAPGVRRN